MAESARTRKEPYHFLTFYRSLTGAVIFQGFPMLNPRQTHHASHTQFKGNQSKMNGCVKNTNDMPIQIKPSSKRHIFQLFNKKYEEGKIAERVSETENHFIQRCMQEK
jgi:hypothetical protein